MKVHTVGSILLLGMVGTFTGCGKHETTGGAMGATAGAIIGSGLSDRHNRTTGAVLGGIIGNMIGGSVGRAADHEEAEERQHEVRVRREREQELARREAEVRRAQAGLDRWCLSCHRQNGIAGAYRCPSCGDPLIREKYCDGCLTAFSPTSVYRYCPYCHEKRRLLYR